MSAFLKENTTGIMVRLLDSNYMLVDLIEDYISLNWAERYIGPGEFELVLPATEKYLSEFQLDRYLAIETSDVYMVIEKIVLASDFESGATITLSGRTLECVLARRVIYPGFLISTLQALRDKDNEDKDDEDLTEEEKKKKEEEAAKRAELERIYASLYNLISELFAQNVINPKNINRRIPGITLASDSSSTILNSIPPQTDYSKSIFLDTLVDLCTQYDVGFKAIPTSNGGFTFYMYTGTDRSWSQNKNQYVIFSKTFDNLVATSYVKSKAEYKNACFTSAQIEWVETKNFMTNINPVTGEPIYDIAITKIHSDTKEYEITRDRASGRDRYEMVAQNEIDKPDGYTEFTSEEEWGEYLSAVKESAKKELEETEETSAVDGDMDAFGQFAYGTHFFLGDIVQVENEFGIQARCRVSEFVISIDASGITYVPTFTFLQ